MTITKRSLLGTSALVLATVATGAFASSHREAPGITEEPKIDGTDFYMFRSYEPGRQDFVTFIANYQPIQAPYGGPNYFTMDPDAIYEIHIDQDGDAIEDVTYRFQFDNFLNEEGSGLGVPVGEETGVAIPLRAFNPGDSNDTLVQNEFESYTLTQIVGDRLSGDQSPVTNGSGGNTTFMKPLDNIGSKTIPDYDSYEDDFLYEIDVPGCDTPGRVFVGQRAEAFAVNLGPVFDSVNFVPLEGSIDQDSENNDLRDVNVTSMAIELPIDCVTGNGNGVIGAWTTSSLPQAEVEDPSPEYDATSVFGGAYVQQSRLSAPLVNELVIGLPDKDLFNAAEPMDDAALATYVTNPTLPFLLEALFGVSAPTNFPRTDLVKAFLTGFPGVNQLETVTPSEMMRLNTAIDTTAQTDQNSLGVLGGDNAGFPNGRRPGDDVVDIALRVVMGVLCYTDFDECTPDDAQSGDLAYTDGAPLDAGDVQNEFPYLNTPYSGSER